MFNKKINNDNKKISIKHSALYKHENILLTETVAVMMSNYFNNKSLQDKMEYQDNITSYINRKYEYGIKKQYNPIIVNLCEDGKIVINNDEYNLKDFFIVYNDHENIFHLKCIDEKYNSDRYQYNKAVKFIDTTAFINLINSGKPISNNKIILKDKNELENIINKWDGYLHSETKETEAVINKKMIKDDGNE